MESNFGFGVRNRDLTPLAVTALNTYMAKHHAAEHPVEPQVVPGAEQLARAQAFLAQVVGPREIV